MKKIILLATLIISLNTFSQNITVIELDVIENYDEPYFRCTHKLVIDEETNDTTSSVSITFYKNNNYSDVVTIPLYTDETVKQLYQDLSTAIKRIQSKKDMNYERAEYKISISENKVMLGHKKDFGKILLDLKNSENILRWIKGIKLTRKDNK